MVAQERRYRLHLAIANKPEDDPRADAQMELSDSAASTMGIRRVRRNKMERTVEGLGERGGER